MSPITCSDPYKSLERMLCLSYLPTKLTKVRNRTIFMGPKILSGHLFSKRNGKVDDEIS